MKDSLKTKAQLISEMGELRKRPSALEAGGVNRKPTDEILIESELKFRNVIEESQEGIYLVDEQGRIILWNSKLAKITEIPAVEAVNQFVWDVQFRLTPEEQKKPETHETLKTGLLKFLETGQAPWATDNLLRDYLHADGSRVFSEERITAIRTGKGYMLVNISRDISERKQIEENLKKSEERYRAVFENAIEGIIQSSPQGRYLSVNPAFARMIGYASPEEAIANISDIGQQIYSHPEDRERTQKLLIEHGRVENYEVMIKHKNGQNLWVLLNTHVVRDQQGAILYYEGSVIDISDLKRIEDDLYRSKQILQLILDNIPLLVYWKDCDLTYLGCNKVCANEAKLADPSEILGKTDFDLPWKEVAQRYRDVDRQVMATNAPKLNLEEPIPQSDGTMVWVRTNKVPLHDRDGKVIGMLGTSESITERKQAEEELRKANEKLTSWVGDLEQRNSEANLLRQMGDLLQVCNELDEAYGIIKEFGPRLFLSTCGALYIINNSRRSAEAKAVWGERLQSESDFGLNECWALRRGHIHLVRSTTPGLICRHMIQPFSGSYIDIPMVASSESIGVLHIEGMENSWPNEGSLELARNVAEHLSLALMNLKLHETLRYQSIRDPLTGLFNRRYLEESLDREIQRAIRKHHQIGVFMLDIDHFKDFNDTFGHEAGDIVLRELGNLLQHHVRAEDIACRFGGEEFILILPETSRETAQERAEHIREAIKSMSVEHHHQPLGMISVSVGVAVFPEHSSNVEGILRKVDEALYQAKHKGRDRVEVASI